MLLPDAGVDGHGEQLVDRVGGRMDAPIFGGSRVAREQADVQGIELAYLATNTRLVVGAANLDKIRAVV